MHRRKESDRRLVHAAAGRGSAGADSDPTGNDALARALVDWCGYFEICEREACFRAGRCRGVGVPCFEENAEGCYELLSEVPVGERLFDLAVEAANGFAK